MAAPPMEQEVTVPAATSWHGYLLKDENLRAPKCVTTSDVLARPKYTTVKSAEYLDYPEVLDAKVDLLIRMWSAASHPLVYAGAGISTSAGIRDYASTAAGSKVQPAKKALTMTNILALRSTPAHRVITALERRGMVWGWLQQNHDGLAQKAGFPAHKVNELHGSWLDNKHNPIIAMSGELRGDLFEWACDMEKMCDFVFTVGTSLSGLNADRVFHTCAKRHSKSGRGQGSVILSIQRTPHDESAALRIFARIDDVMLLMAKKMQLKIDEKDYEYAPAPRPVGAPADDVWMAERREKSARAAADDEAAAARAERRRQRAAAAADTQRLKAEETGADTATIKDGVAKLPVIPSAAAPRRHRSALVGK